MMKRLSTSRRSSSPPRVVKPPRTRADREVAGHLLSVLRAGGDARLVKIKRVRQKVKSRSYENELKLSIAVDRMARELAP